MFKYSDGLKRAGYIPTKINPYFCRQKPRPMNERGASLL